MPAETPSPEAIERAHQAALVVDAAAEELEVPATLILRQSHLNLRKHHPSLEFRDRHTEARHITALLLRERDRFRDYEIGRLLNYAAPSVNRVLSLTRRARESSPEQAAVIGRVEERLTEDAA